MPNSKDKLEFKYPPDIQKCHNHRLANRIFKGLDQGVFAAECQCCERKIGSKQQSGSCCYHNIELAFIGPGIPLLFNFLASCIVLLVVLCITFVGYTMYSNYKGGNCVPAGSCSDNIFEQFSIINKLSSTSELSIQNYVLVIFVVANVFLMHYFRYSFRKVQDQCDDLVNSPSDYALILRRLPDGTRTTDIEKMIDERRMFLTPQQKQKTQNLRIINIVMSFSMTEYKKVRTQNTEQFSKLLSEGKHEQFKPKKLPDLEEPASIAIIVFAKQQSKQLFKYKPNICQKLLQCIWTPCIPLSDYRIKGENISVERAPEPDDILWENSKISMKGAICRKTMYSLFAILLLFAGGCIQYALALAQTKVSQDSNTQLIMSTTSSIAIFIINVVIQVFLVYTSEKERNETLTEFNTVLMVKISLFQFLNTGVFVVAANFLADPYHFSISKGFVFQVVQVMIMNAIIPNLSLFVLTYCEIVLKIKRCLIERGTLKMSQKDANKQFQGPAVQLPYKYAYIFKTIWLTAFYAPLAPIVVPIGIVGLLFNYAVQKLLFGRVYSSPCRISSMVNDSAIELLQYFSLILSLGEFIIFVYFYQFRPELLPLNWSIPIYISIAISALNLLLPMDSINNKIFKIAADNLTFPDYQKVEDSFQVTYEMTNPGYVCKKKRNRDLLMITTMYRTRRAHDPNIQMTNLGLLPLSLPGLTPSHPIPIPPSIASPVLGHQDSPYQSGNPNQKRNSPSASAINSNNPNNPSSSNNPNNPSNPSLPNNPLGVIFSSVKSNKSATNTKTLNLPVTNPHPIEAINFANQFNPSLLPPNANTVASIAVPETEEVNQLNQAIENIEDSRQTQQIDLLEQQEPIVQDNKPPTFNGNNSLRTSLTGAFPPLLPVVPQNLGFNQQQTHLTGSLASPTSLISQKQSKISQMGSPTYFNGMGSPAGNWGGSINIVPESQQAYSSTRRLRKALELQRNQPTPR